MCSCIGTQKWVHERCLREWQQTQIQQALHHRAKMCEVGGDFGARQAQVARCAECGLHACLSGGTLHRNTAHRLWATAPQGCAEGLGCGIKKLS